MKYKDLKENDFFIFTDGDENPICLKGKSGFWKILLTELQFISTCKKDRSVVKPILPLWFVNKMLDSVKK